ncbi:O-Glycosyl hydrolase family 30, partial [Rhizoctonia solani]
MSDDGAKPSQEIERTGSIDNGPNIAAAVDSQLEKKLVRKLDAVILPLTCALYLLAYLDRSNLGNARLQGLPEDVLGGDPTGAKFDWVSSMFYFSYILSQIPAVVTSKLFRPRIWIGCATIGWGLASTLQAAAFNFQGLLATRFFLGVFEAGFGPMIPLYYTFFYTKHEMGVRLSIWFGFAAVAGAFGGLIAYGVQHINSYLANWRILFLVEGCPTIALGILTLFTLPDRPDTTKWLHGAQKDLAIERMSRGGMKEEAGTLNKTHVIAALKDWRVYACGIIYFGVNIALASIGVFLPTIIKTFGYTNAKAQLLTVPPYAVAAVVMMGVSYMSDRTQNRGFFMASASAVGALGYLSVLGTHSYPASEGPHYIKGLALCCGFEFLGALMCLVLTISFRLENARRDRVYGPPEEGKVVDTRELADKSKFISTYAKLLQTPATVPPTEKRFWDDVFCLSPDISWLRDKMSGLGRAGLLGTHQHVITAIFAAAKDEFNTPRTTAKDEITPVELSPNNTTLQTTMSDQDKAHVANSNGGDGQDATSVLRRMNATRTLQAVAQAVLAIPGITGWEIMDVMAGGVGVSDAVFTELVGSLMDTMGNDHESDEMRHSALQLTLALACGFGQLSPGAYLLAQDMFPAIVSLIRSPTTTWYSFEAFLLLAILANYHRADAASLNPYLKHIQETDDTVLIHGLLWVTRYACSRSVKAYRDIHDDTPPSFTSTMSSIFSAFRPAAAPPPMKELFAGQPIEASVVLFPFFEYMSRNRVFRAMLAETIHPDPIKSQSRPTSPRLQTTRPPLGSPKNTGTPLGSPRLRPSSLIMAGRTASMASIVQKAHANAQLHQNVRCVPEFVSLASYILAHAGSTSSGAGREEAYAGLILDILEQCVADEGIMRAICSPPTEGDSAVWLCRQMLKLEQIEYHWNELWRTIIATLVFVLAKQDVVASGTIPIEQIIVGIVQVLDLAVACADGFLPTPEAVHQLVYEMVRASPTLQQLKEREQSGKYKHSLQDLLMTIEFYEDQLEGTNSADNVMRVLAREIERDGVHGVSTREREEPVSVEYLDSQMASRALIFLPALFDLVNGATVLSARAQTFNGVGGSGAWWPNDLHHFPESVKRNLSDLLFSEKGLGLSSYRYNLGGGGLGVSTPARAPETFYVSQGVYNWSADAQGLYFLKAAADRGVPQLTAFVNSGPRDFTTNGQSCGGLFKTGTEAGYGQYIADTLDHIINTLRIPVSYLSPFNEPDNSFGPVPCGQEGMQTNPNQRAAVINGIYNKLVTKGLQSKVGIMADESSNLGLAQNEYASWLPQVLDKIAVICHHTYDFPTDANYLSYVNYVKSIAPNKETWMSEVCCSVGAADASDRKWSGGYDPTIRGGLHFATMMMQSFIVVQETHYDFWTLLSSMIGCSPLGNPSCVNSINTSGWQDGLIYYDPNYAQNGNFALYLTKHYWTMKHFGNFVKPGFVRHAVDGSNTRILAVESDTTFTLLAINPYTTQTTIPVSFQDTSLRLQATHTYRTSATEDFASVGLPVLSNGSWSLILAPTSLTTWVFSKVK